VTIFVDSSVWYAAVFEKDAHQRACDGWCSIEMVTNEDLAAAELIRASFADQRFSLIDRTSFAFLERLGISRVASFDNDFVVYRYGIRRDRAFEVLR
jgi:predicted nucleic acid-binding protein